MKKKGLLFSIALFSTLLPNLHANPLFEEIEQKKLYENPYWKKLLHFRNGESEIDSKEFFLSKDGKKDLKSELYATVNKIINDKNSLDKNIQCRFPLRTKWLKENLQGLEKEIKVTPNCVELNKFLITLNPQELYLIFPTAHINSPASMYGHTFLTISSNKNTPLISNAINYAAKTNETNGLVFAYKGIFGGYEGRYSILPYYQKIKEYNNLEQRDIWEYKLDFTKDEIEKLLLHTFEIKDIYSDYFFFLENCSYNLLWLLEVSKKDLELVNNFSVKTIPIDTIKLLEEKKLIKSSRYRYSKMKKMNHILAKIDDTKLLKRLIEGDLKVLDNLDIDKKVLYLDFYIEYLQYQRSKNEMSKKEYVKSYFKLLRKRASLKKKSIYDIKSPINPLKSHDSSRVMLSYINDDSLNFGIKSAFHDEIDSNYGYLQGAYIDFFDLNLNITKEKIDLDNFELLNIKSYSLQNEIFKPISWSVEVNYEKFYEEKDYFKLKPSIGISRGNEKFFYNMMFHPVINSGKEFFYGGGYSLGFEYNYSKSVKLSTNYNHTFYNKNLEYKKFKSFVTYNLSKDKAINIKYENDNVRYNKRDRLFLSYVFYF